MSTRKDEFLKSLRATFKVEGHLPDRNRTHRRRPMLWPPRGCGGSGYIARLVCRSGPARFRDFATTLHLLGGSKPSDLLPETDGLTAGRLTEMITSIIAMAARL